MGAQPSKSPASKHPSKSPAILPHGVNSDDTSHIRLSSSHRTLYAGLIALIQKNKYSDLLLICGGDRYPVHRAIVCPRSTWFEDRCDEAIRGSDNRYQMEDTEAAQFSPASPLKIWIDPSECSPRILAAVLMFLYTLNYPSNASDPHLVFGLPYDQTNQESSLEEEDAGTETGSLIHLDDKEQFETFIRGEEDESVVGGEHSPMLTPSITFSTDDGSHTSHEEDPSTPTNELMFHVQMYKTGQRFGISALCDVAREKFHRRLAANTWKAEMLPCIREVYRQQDNGGIVSLKDEIVKSAKSRFRVLRQIEGWDDVVMEFPEFAATMLKQV